MEIVSSVNELAQLVAEDIFECYEKAISERGFFSIAISGGNTPKHVFQALVDEFGQRIDWDNVHIFWTDERMVPPEHADSNYFLACNYLLPSCSGAKVYRIFGEIEGSESARAYSETLGEYFDNYDRCIDYMMLGMGDDGHTASLFPNVEYTSDSDYAVATKVPVNGHFRVSLTSSVINDARHRIIMITNNAKWAKFKGEPELPVHSIVKHATTIILIK